MIDASSSSISWIGSLQLCLFIGGTTVAGPIFDLGYLSSLLLTGTILTTLGLMMTSLCSTYWQLLLAQGVCTGLGMTCLFIPCVAVVPAYFSSRRALAMSIGASGSSIGAIVFTVVFERLRPRIGFGWTVRVMGFITLASLLLPAFTMRKLGSRSPARAFIDRSAFQEPATVITYASMLLVFMGLYIPYFYNQVCAEQEIGENNISQYLIVVLNTGSFFGRLFPSLLADKIGPMNTIVPCAAFSSIVGFCWIAVRDRAGTVAFCAIYGFFSGSFVSLTAVLWASLCPDVNRMGTRTGMMTVPVAAGLLLGNPIAGELVRGRSFVRLQVFCATTVMAATCLLVAARWSISGFDVRRKV
ncbi:hypothetical protein LTS10_011761 [Elasticomyces elasticus]|nr:hypothetical protein LTS10_011761 [Elasticomyces elasticus]